MPANSIAPYLTLGQSLLQPNPSTLSLKHGSLLPGRIDRMIDNCCSLWSVNSDVLDGSTASARRAAHPKIQMKRLVKKPTEGKIANNVAFRLDAEFIQALEDKAAQRKQNRHKLARDYVVDALKSKETLQDTLEALGKLYAEVQVMRREVQFLRQDLALATESLLHSAGKISPDDASQWAAENLNVDWQKSPGKHCS